MPSTSSCRCRSLCIMIYYGCEQIISRSACGVLIDIAENTFLVSTKALRDEGSSYHYFPPSRFVNINQKALKVIEKTLMSHK